MPIRFDEDDSGTNRLLLVAAGALAGVAVGMLLAKKYGGPAEISSRLKDRLASRSRAATAAAEDEDGFEDIPEDEIDDEESELEDRVLEAFYNDPVLSERAVDIGAVAEGIIELSGWVHDDTEIAHAITLTRGVPGVETVVSRLIIRDEDAEFANRTTHESAPADGHWEGQQVGMGKKHQGSSAEFGRHATPKADLQDRWLSEAEAERNAAEDIEPAERRSGRTDALAD